MREILFRGKNIDNGHWMYGVPISLKNGETYMNFEFMGWIDRALVIPETVGQYTGLTDKNGTKIFEGDIICGKAGPPFEIRWRKSMCYFSIYAKDVPYPLAPVEKGIVRNYEVIGNIYDNPELLEGKS